ncbi:UDP-glycosyltransferase [Ananas comosus]|uniref:Glycosyltransferase n=1 Tax=Ananas comosus TaxID=4615 RepID=A0A199W7N9_ANACO|nr:UDP-glycosyltransferase [Ananas comosus]
MAAAGGNRAPHIVLLPSAGMGHLIPFSRLAAALSALGCDVSFVVVHPTVSAAETRHVSDLLAAFPAIRPLPFHLPPLNSSVHVDPFFLQFEAIRLSAPQLITCVLNSSSSSSSYSSNSLSPPVSALVIDISLASAFIPVAAEFRLPSYILFTSSAAMLSLCAYFPTYADAAAGVIGDIDIPGVQTLPRSWLPQALHNPGHLFTTQFVENGRALGKADGIVVNTFDAIEREALAALNAGKVAPGLPPAIAVGPLLPPPLTLRLREGPRASPPLSWLDSQPPRSVVYVGFGSRTAMSSAQMRELAIGLEMSGCKFLWVVKSRVVDRDEDEDEDEEDNSELREVLERVKGRGMVVKGWVEQAEVLGRESVGGFISHCGWNSVMEAAVSGTPVLAWPRHGDQRVNAEVVRRCGLGIWEEEWSWEGENGVVVVKGEEIARCVRRLMDDEGVRASAARGRGGREECGGRRRGKGLRVWVARVR